MKVIITKGLPASGKTTWVRKLMEKEPDTYKRVNKDLLREMVDFGNYSLDNEVEILNMRNMLIAHFLDMGYDVIVDDTNLNPRHIKDIVQLIAYYEENRSDLEVGDIEVVVQEFNVPVEECIKRDSQRENGVGEKVIRDMYEKYPQKIETEKSS